MNYVFVSRRTGSVCAIIALIATLSATSFRANAQSGPVTVADVPKNTPLAAPTSTPSGTDLTKDPTLYEVPYTHLDTEWCWTYPQVINEFIKNTLDQNFALFDKYPDYIFNWTGANRYKFMKEYYPVEYAKLKTYVAQGRWVNTGSSLEEGDVCIPSEESIIRHVLYGNEFYKKEFNSASTDFILPDCFGFPASLPSILAHCGLNGFATQKLSWGSGERTMGQNGIPFNLGVWVGPDNQGVYAELNAVNYYNPLNDDASNDKFWIDRLNQDGKNSGFYAEYNYIGYGDRGGGLHDSDAINLEKSVHGTGPVHVVASRDDQIFNDLEKYDTSSLPKYKGDLLLTFHNSGSATSQAEQKRWNHENEKLADATERASVAADWLGALPYDKARITDAWWKFLPGQFHDLMAGTALPLAYVYSWNDEVLALNEFAGQLQESVGGVTRALDTSGPGVPIVVYNPISIARQDDVTATVTFPATAPDYVEVVGTNGAVTPSQVLSRSGSSVKVLFYASAPSVGYSTYWVRSATSAQPASDLKASASGLENGRFRVAIDSSGDVSSIYDKIAHTELLAAPLRLSFQHENPGQYPAWNMDWSDQSAPPIGYVDGPAKISVVENGPVKVAVQIDRWARGSHFIETISLAHGEAGDRVEFANSIDWKSTEAALMVYLPTTVSNPWATYNWELGTIKRTTDTPDQYEVPAHQWFDLTDMSGSYGVTVLSGDRYGSDKPNDSTLRLTLVYTPGTQGGFHHQATNDWGHHELTYAITGHSGDWTPGNTQWIATRFDRPLIAFQTTAHAGVLGNVFSFVKLNNKSVSVEALKQAEYSHKIVVRFNELAGKPESDVKAEFAAPVVSAIEVDGQEAPIGPATIVNGDLAFDLKAYRPRAFELTLGNPPVKLAAPTSNPVALAYNINVEKPFGSASGGSFDDAGDAIPAEMLPTDLVSDGIKFNLAPASAATDAVQCAGQKISVTAAPGSKLYILAASSNGDISAPFTIAGKTQNLTVQSWNGYIGQWDNRLWGGDVPKLTYDVVNPMIGLVPGYIKRDTVAWYSDHYRGADGTNQTYMYCYLYRYAFKVPTGKSTIILPNNSAVKILAATVATDPNSAIEPAQLLYDTLVHPIDPAPHIDAKLSADGSSAVVTAIAPLYFNPNSDVHYTLDGTAPTLSSAVYSAPVMLNQSSVVKAAYVNSDGTVEGVTSYNVTVDHPSGPSVVSAVATDGTHVLVHFSEPVSQASAENTSNYSFSTGNSVTGSSLSLDGLVVHLTLASAFDTDADSTLSVSGVVAAVPGGLPVASGIKTLVDMNGCVFEATAVQSYNGTTNGLSIPVPDLPTAASAPWTINLYAYFTAVPGELTTLAGFGDDQDNAGTQRYILKFKDGIHFWASNVDVTSGIPYDLGKWQMVTATFDGTTLSLYKNGALIKTAPISLNDVAPMVKIAPPGPWAGGNKLNGRIAGVKIYTRALTRTEITSLMAAMPQN